MAKKLKNIDQAKKWNKRADTYPRFSEESSGIETRVINLAKSAGVTFNGKSVLDIGCGTGRFTIRIAKMADQVTGTDISENMLEILREDAASEGIENIEAVCSDWTKFTDNRKWDITMATLTPAMRAENQFKRMIDMARNHVIYLGWMDRKECPMVAEIFTHHGIKPDSFKFPGALIELLENSDYNYKMFPVEDSWIREGSVKQIAERFEDDLKEYGVEPDTKAIKDTILKYSDDGENISYKVEVILRLIIINKK